MPLTTSKASMPSSVHQLVALVRHAFHGTPLPEAPLPWHDLYNQACRQNVVSLLQPAVAEQIKRLLAADPAAVTYSAEKDKSTPLTLVLDMWDQAAAKTIQRSNAQFTVLFMLAKLMEGHGIGLLVLKGYGLSANYPNPMLRLSSDIDIFPFDLKNPAPDHGATSRRVDELVKKTYGVTVEGAGTDHHTSFTLGGVQVENHFKVVGGGISRPSKAFEKQMQTLAFEDMHPVTVQDSTIYLPSVKMTALHLLRHAAKHFAGLNISIRHLLDWAMFVSSPRFQQAKEDLWPWLVEESKHNKLDQFLGIINAICVEDLGFQSSHFLQCPYDATLKERVYRSIFNPAPCDLPHPIDTPLLTKIRLWNQNNWKRRAFSTTSILEAFLTKSITYLPNQRKNHRTKTGMIINN